MDYTLLKKNSIQSNVKMNNENTIIHLLPDFGLDVRNYINNSGFNKFNLQGIVIKNIKFKNTRLDTKQYIDNIRSDEEKLGYKMFLTIPSIVKNKYLIVDHSITIERMNDLRDRYSTTQINQMLLDYLQTEYKNIKETNPTYHQIVVCYLENLDGLYKNLASMANAKIDYKFFDKMVLVNTSNKQIIPLMGYEKTGIEYYKSNLGFIQKVLSDSISDKSDSDALASLNKSNEIKSGDITSDDVKKSNSEKLLGTEKISEVDYNKLRLSDIIKKYNIKDPYTGNIIKKAIEDYQSKNDTSKDELELVVLKAINFSLFGKKEIDQIYLDTPELLFNKIEEKSNFNIPVIWNKLKKEKLVHPKDIVKLEYMSGPLRLEYEFSENIHEGVNRLLKTLEHRKNPVKIVKVNHEVKDNNLDRFIEYSIVLQNVVGGHKEPYEVRLRVPTLVNGRYFKFSGKEYIISAQQFLQPITKNRPNEARLNRI